MVRDVVPMSRGVAVSKGSGLGGRTGMGKELSGGRPMEPARVKGLPLRRRGARGGVVQKKAMGCGSLNVICGALSLGLARAAGPMGRGRLVAARGRVGGVKGSCLGHPGTLGGIPLGVSGCVPRAGGLAARGGSRRGTLLLMRRVGRRRRLGGLMGRKLQMISLVATQGLEMHQRRL